MKLALTGGSGFIGARFAARWLAAGHELRALVRASSRTDALSRLGAEVAVVDLETGTGLDEALDGVELVLHLAGVVRAWDRATYERVNSGATRHLARAARRQGVARFVFVSSLAAAGPSSGGRPLREEDEPRPIAPYGESKLSAERALAEVAGDELAWSIVRPTIVYGPGDRDVYELFKLCRRRIVPYASPPEARISLIHVDDLIDLLEACLERGPAQSLYFASDGGAYSWPELIDAIGVALGREVQALRVPPRLLAPMAAAAGLLRPFRARPPVFCLEKMREALHPSWLCSPAKAGRELGFAPRVEVRAGLRDTASWYLAEGWL